MFTDHKNLTYKTIKSTSQRVQIWKIPIQEFGATLIYIKGEVNIVINAFSQIPMVNHAHKLSDKNMK